MPLAAESDIIVLIWLVYKRTGMSSSLLSYSSKGYTFRAGLFINTDQVFTIISSFVKAGLTKVCIYIYISRIYQFKGPPYAFWRLKKKYRAREWERRRNERVRGKRELVPLRWQGLQARKDVTEKSKFIFFLFSSNLPKMTDSISKWRLCMLIYSSGFLCVP